MLFESRNLTAVRQNGVFTGISRFVGCFLILLFYVKSALIYFYYIICNSVKNNFMSFIIRMIFFKYRNYVIRGKKLLFVIKNIPV